MSVSQPVGRLVASSIHLYLLVRVPRDTTLLKTCAHKKETMFFTNVVPMNSMLFNGGWKELEERVRKLVKKYKEVFVVTGAH